MIATLVAAAAFLFAAGPAWLFARNLGRYRHPPTPHDGSTPRVSILIPARNEERTIAAAVEASLLNRGVELEVLVLDDRSEDATSTIVRELADGDPRVRLIVGPEPPPGWCGKQHACAILASSATHDRLLFIDADVRLAPDAAARLVAFQDESGADLVSGVPCQETGTLAERMVIPLIHFILLAFLPLGRSRQSGHPAYGVGCGQLFLARRSGYQQSGGHAAIRASRHDGLKLPRAFRVAGFKTDLFDATCVASCRMYRGFGEVWRGLAKNATEGFAAPRLIVPMTLVLLGGQVLPVALLTVSPRLPTMAVALAAVASLCAYAPRLIAAVRFRQSYLSAVLHPIGVAAFVAMQWIALLRKLSGRPSVWKGRLN